MRNICICIFYIPPSWHWFTFSGLQTCRTLVYTSVFECLMNMCLLLRPFCGVFWSKVTVKKLQRVECGILLIQLVPSCCNRVGRCRWLITYLYICLSLISMCNMYSIAQILFHPKRSMLTVGTLWVEAFTVSHESTVRCCLCCQSSSGVCSANVGYPEIWQAKWWIFLPTVNIVLSVGRAA